MTKVLTKTSKDYRLNVYGKEKRYVFLQTSALYTFVILFSLFHLNTSYKQTYIGIII